MGSQMSQAEQSYQTSQDADDETQTTATPNSSSESTAFAPRGKHGRPSADRRAAPRTGKGNRTGTGHGKGKGKARARSTSPIFAPHKQQQRPSSGLEHDKSSIVARATAGAAGAADDDDASAAAAAAAASPTAVDWAGDGDRDGAGAGDSDGAADNNRDSIVGPEITRKDLLAIQAEARVGGLVGGDAVTRLAAAWGIDRAHDPVGWRMMDTIGACVS